MPSKSDIWKNGVVLSFDLDTIKLRDYYSKTSPQGAYEIIKHFLKKNGFKHEKDSDYVNVKIVIESIKRTQWLNIYIV